VRIKTEIARAGNVKGTAKANTKSIWKRTVRRAATNAVAVEAVVVVDQKNADINPDQELWVVPRPPKELGLGRH